MAVYKEDDDDRLMDTTVRVCKLVVLLACELGDRAPAADAVSNDVIVQPLVFLGRPEALAELGLHAAAAGEPSHSPLPRTLSLCSDDDGDKLRERATSVIDRCHLQWRSVAACG